MLDHSVVYSVAKADTVNYILLKCISMKQLHQLQQQQKTNMVHLKQNV